ncbi:MAG TPA: tRNA epoxyqueuosine(34) reductase QueG [Bdellovibrionales bacterium]|nr:MAG: tRNA epoxyqueuosine(34) reductase QueG [Bdellovibrionales bacterium GWA1_52_35]HAR41878.1 tRNA epoxyqueuosine(34) reductase QueG [Bdellovibrionales bacterium]HCM40853.1 tRNA epoxyqueuosine(34) reductase QueG [Bdellovibrionales bacterium]
MLPPLYTELSAAAAQAGFPLFGAVDLSLAEEVLSEHFCRYEEWVKDGKAGEMGYLVRERARAVRRNPELLLPGAKAAVCFGLPYNKNPRGALDPTQGPRSARYLEGPDYHNKIKDRLNALMNAFVHSSKNADLHWKVCVDTSAVLERSWSAAAGLGWIGKNTLLIHPSLGSYFFLAVVFLNQELGQAPSLLRGFCGHCTRCIDACPTGALSEKGLDARRCISYLTLEKRGSFSDEEHANLAKAGTWVAGCDLCQEVCPYNQKSARGHKSPISPASWAELLAESPEQFQRRVEVSALNRIKPSDFDRNLAVALKNALPALSPGSGVHLRKQIQERLTCSSHPELWKKCLESVSES